MHFLFITFEEDSHSVCNSVKKSHFIHIVSQASYVYILSGQKFIKNTKNGPFWLVFENLKFAVKQCYQIGHFNRTKISGKCLKLLKMSHLSFSILEFSIIFCLIKIDLSGNSVWLQTSGFQKLIKMNHIWHFQSTFVYAKCKRSLLHSQCWIRLFLWFSNTLSVCYVYSYLKIPPDLQST